MIILKYLLHKFQNDLWNHSFNTLAIVFFIFAIIGLFFKMPFLFKEVLDERSKS